MSELFTSAVSITGYAIEAAGVVIVLFGFIFASYRIVTGQHGAGEDKFTHYRRELGRSMLLGLEFLVAGDIIRTVVVDHSMQSILALGLIVLIRTVLVFTIHLEVHGHWPWNKP
ncbi:MAG: DUF1622 domain-containing protein [Gammaproteobacteria bacterium]